MDSEELLDSDDCSLRNHDNNLNKIDETYVDYDEALEYDRGTSGNDDYPSDSDCRAKLYRDERYMVRHMRTVHSGSKGVPCPLCKKMVSSNVVLRQHILTHSKRKIYSCNICPRQFSVKRSTLKHMRRRHGVSLNGDEVNIDVYFKTLDVRDCNLGLDDEYINKLFGPRKQVVDITFGEFPFAFPFVDETKKSDGARPGTSRRNVPKRKESKQREAETESDSSDNGNNSPELQPTDFVSVKIEPMQEDDDDMEDVD